MSIIQFFQKLSPQIIIRTALISLILSVGMSFQAQALEIDQLRFGVHKEKTRMVIELDESAEFRAFVLGNPYRLIVDLPHFTWQAHSIQKPQKAGIKAIRQGTLQNNISRIVFDLDKPISLMSAFVLPEDKQKPYRLVIDYQDVSAQEFAGKENITLGKLTRGSTQKTSTAAASSKHPALASNQVAPIIQNSAKPTLKQKDLHIDKSYNTASLGNIAPPPQKKPAPSHPSTHQKEKPIIVIDPGHGGVDPGAVGAHKIHEKNVVLNLSKELKYKLEQSGRYRVLLTRSKDTYIRLRDRVEFARKHNADLFVSIHADSVPQSSVKGASVYTLSEKASDKQTAQLAARENRSDIIAGIDLNVEDEIVANILVDLATRDTMNQSKFFANTIVSSFKSKSLRVLENPHRYAGFAVLKAPDIPSILVEAGFMSNKGEAKALNTKAYRSKIVDALSAGIDQYFLKISQNNKI